MAKYKLKAEHNDTLICIKGSGAYIYMRDLTDKQIDQLIEEGFSNYFKKVKAKKEAKS
jgi:hypothetical protein